MSCHKCVGALPAAGLSRRAVLNRFGHGSRRHRARQPRQPAARGAVGAGRPGPRRARRAAPLPAEGEARHLPVHGRRAVADRDVRLQAGARTSATASSCPTRSARASGSPACRATRRRCRSPGRSSGSPARRQPAPGSASCCRTPRKVVDDLCIVRSMYTEAINHDPAITFFQTGSQIAGRPSMGAWLHYGLGSDNEDLPAFVVLITPGKVDQPLYARLWGSGFLPSRAPGRAVPERQGAGALPRQPRRACRARAAGCCSIGCASCTRTRPSSSATPKSTRASRSTRWRTACRRACPA